MGFPWGEVVVIVGCVVIPTVAQKIRAINTPATRMKKALRHRLGKVHQQITPLLVIGAKKKPTRRLPAGNLTAPSLPRWSVGPVEPWASPPER